MSFDKQNYGCLGWVCYYDVALVCWGCGLKQQWGLLCKCEYMKSNAKYSQILILYDSDESDYKKPHALNTI